MPLVMIVTRDVTDRYRGYLGSLMLEVAPTVYISPRMNPGVRTRTWGVLSDWYAAEPQGSVAMVWRDADATGGIGIATLGTTPRELVEVDGLWLVRKRL
jgi:CRISPR-associated protein Cas2